MTALVELYRFVEGGLPDIVYTFTNADRPITHNEEVYLPIPIIRTQVESKNDLSRSDLTLRFDLLNVTARRWMSEFLDSLVFLTVFEKDEEDEISVIWKGRMSGVKPSSSQIALVFESIFTSLRRPGVRARFQRTCRHSLYGRGCNVNKDNHKVMGHPTALNSVVVTVPEAAEHPDGWFSLGMMALTTGEVRFIVNHIGDQLTLLQPFLPLGRAMVASGYGGISVTLYPGCDRLRATCNDKFDNLDNHGGFDWIPLRNPYDGSSIV